MKGSLSGISRAWSWGLMRAPPVFEDMALQVMAPSRPAGTVR